MAIIGRGKNKRFDSTDRLGKTERRIIRSQKQRGRERERRVDVREVKRTELLLKRWLRSNI